MVVQAKCPDDAMSEWAYIIGHTPALIPGVGCFEYIPWNVLESKRDLFLVMSPEH